MRLVVLSGALSIIDIGQNFEVVINASILDTLWKRMAHPHPVCAQKGDQEAFGLFNLTIEMVEWANRGSTVKGFPCYCPVVKCRGDLKDIYVCEVNEWAMEYSDQVNREALKIYTPVGDRWENDTAIRDLDILFFPTYR